MNNQKKICVQATVVQKNERACGALKLSSNAVKQLVTGLSITSQSAFTPRRPQPCNESSHGVRIIATTITKESNIARWSLREIDDARIPTDNENSSRLHATTTTRQNSA